MCFYRRRIKRGLKPLTTTNGIQLVLNTGLYVMTFKIQFNRNLITASTVVLNDVYYRI